MQNGTPLEQDWYAATEVFVNAKICIIFYYTGFCEGNRGKKGKHEQGILRAVSKDLVRWEKDKKFAFYPDEEHFGRKTLERSTGILE